MNAFYESPSFGGSEDYEILDGVKVSRADRAPCPVCGHSTGDCAPPDEVGPGIIFGYNTNSTLDDTQTFVVPEDIYDQREIAPGVTMRLLLYKQGKVIPLIKAKELGLI
jgi:hypothetical protein